MVMTIIPENLVIIIKAVEVSINKFLVTAAAEKLSALLTQDYLETEAAKGKREDFQKVLKAVPHKVPEQYDSL